MKKITLVFTISLTIFMSLISIQAHAEYYGEWQLLRYTIDGGAVGTPVKHCYYQRKVYERKNGKQLRIENKTIPVVPASQKCPANHF